MNEKEENTNTNNETAEVTVGKDIRDPEIDKIIAATQDAMRHMREPITTIALSNLDEKAIGVAIEQITGIAFDLAKKSFGIGMEAGASIAKDNFMAALDKVEKRFFERTGMVQP